MYSVFKNIHSGRTENISDFVLIFFLDLILSKIPKEELFKALNIIKLKFCYCIWFCVMLLLWCTLYLIFSPWLLLLLCSKSKNRKSFSSAMLAEENLGHDSSLNSLEERKSISGWMVLYLLFFWGLIKGHFL